jgi:hypothetical protein
MQRFASLFSRHALLAVALAGFGGAATAAEDIVAYDGRWDVLVPQRPTVRLVIQDFVGTWQEVGKAADPKRAACLNKKLPLTVQHSSSKELEFTVWGVDVSPGCPNLTIALKPVDDRTMEGTVDDAQPIRIRRQKPLR